MVPTGIQAGAGAGPLAGHGPLPAAAGENDDAQAYSTFGMRCWETGGPALKLCGQIADICPDEAFVKKLALHCTREKLEPCHMLCVVEDALAGGLPG